jgi:soluble lytic murein transglycosylase-like protein
MLKNKDMRFCFRLAWTLLAGAATLAAADPGSPRVASVVRADARSGRLVRSVHVERGRNLRPALPVSELRAFAQRTAEKYDVDPLLVHSVIEAESAYDPFAISPKGAQGLMQLMPGTAARFDVRNTFNPWENIDGGVRYLRYLLDLFGEPALALAAYNAGEGSVLRHGGVPPYPETEQYVDKIGKKLAQRPAQPPPSGGDSEDEYLPLEQLVDADGNLHLRTRAEP